MIGHSNQKLLWPIRIVLKLPLASDPESRYSVGIGSKGDQNG
jgi:hypothetical protein